MSPPEKHVLFMCEGSRGDCQPYVGLAVAFQDRGYKVTFATNCDFEDFLKRYGINNFVPFDNKARDLLVQIASAANDNYDPATLIPVFTQFMTEQFPKKRKEVEALALGSKNKYSFILCNIFFHIYLNILYEAFPNDVAPFFLLCLQPCLPTKAFPPIYSNEEPQEGKDYFQETVNITKQYFKPFSGIYNNWRQEVNIELWTEDNYVASIHRGPKAFINGYSRYVVPHPVDFPENSCTLGYWFLDHHRRLGWNPDDKTVSFLEQSKANGKKVVYFGFGSMHHPKPEDLMDVVLKTIKTLGIHAVISEGWGTLRKPQDFDESAHPNILFIHDCEHSWLFPKIDATVIHGGAGTTAAALRAGKPVVICPFFGDQPFWAHRVANLGVGPKGISAFKLTPEILAAQLDQVLHSEEVKARAQEVGRLIEEEDGANNTITKIEEIINKL